MRWPTCQRMRLFFWHLYAKLKFGQVGWPSYAISPIRIIGGKDVHLGSNVTILNDARIEAVSEWGTRKYSPNVIIGSGTDIGQNLHLTCAQNIQIGSYCAILPQVLITDINHDYLRVDTPPVQSSIEVDPVSIGDACIIGMGARILPGVHLGCHCVVGTNAVVRAGEYPDYSVLVGVPARMVKRYNKATGKWERCGT